MNAYPLVTVEYESLGRRWHEVVTVFPNGDMTAQRLRAARQRLEQVIRLYLEQE